jgi:hypothetical protein
MANGSRGCNAKPMSPAVPPRTANKRNATQQAPHILASRCMVLLCDAFPTVTLFARLPTRNVADKAVSLTYTALKRQIRFFGQTLDNIDGRSSGREGTALYHVFLCLCYPGATASLSVCPKPVPTSGISPSKCAIESFRDSPSNGVRERNS